MTRKAFVTGLALGVLTGCGPAEETPQTASPRQAELIAQGRVMAETLCAGCHAIGTEGDSPHREAIPFRELSWHYEVESLAEPFAEGIMVGHPDMPQWQFEPKDIDALLAYLETIQVPRET